MDAVEDKYLVLPLHMEMSERDVVRGVRLSDRLRSASAFSKYPIYKLPPSNCKWQSSFENPKVLLYNIFILY